MTRLALLGLAGLLSIAGGVAIAQHPKSGGGHQPYAGQQVRAITNLSADDVKGFLNGAGMGLAKPAELNGFPGPMHVLELDTELGLTPEQRRRVQAAMDSVKAKARALGEQYVAAERAVDEAFRTNAAREVIAAKVAEAGRLLSAIRFAHLDAHLEITPLLTLAQRQRYSDLRGYIGGGGHAAGQHKH